MKLQGKFYSNIEEAKDSSPSFLSVIPAYDQSPKKIYPIFAYEKFFIVCENEKEMDYFVSATDINIINERLNFTKCKDVDIALYDVCNVKHSTLQCKLSDIKNIYAQMNYDATASLLITFTNDEVINCKKIENIE